jgi:para-aminobenzoate synthetase / 4-amino-4-deoxychorismate lyase
MNFRSLSESQIRDLLNSKQTPFVLLEASACVRGESATYLFSDFEHILTFKNTDNPGNFFSKLQDYLDKGYWAAGYLSYEFGYYLEEALCGLRKDYDFNLAWFGLTRRPALLNASLCDKLINQKQNLSQGIKNVKANIPKEEYIRAIKSIKNQLEEGNTYQVNFTFKVGFDYCGEPRDLYARLRKAQPTAYSALINTGREYFLSHSPELFFKREGCEILTRPMKGTVSRGLSSKADQRARSELKENKKNRAENIMIVDLLRNDLGRVSSKVWVPKLFEVEKHRTLHQMTSTVKAALKESVSLQDLFCGIFPSGSVTGAPKIKTMQIIQALEKEPRNIYTGSIGFLSPEKKACFNVAIRTVHIKDNKGALGIGGGIVYDSVDEDEYKEAMLKANFLLKDALDLGLIETLRFDPTRGFYLMDLHMRRLEQSCEYFSIPFIREKIIDALEKAVVGKTTAQKVRLLVDASGGIFLESQKLNELPKKPKIMLSKKLVSSGDPYLYHKTTLRALYDRELISAQSEGFVEVVFLNEQKQITEGSFTNVFLEKNGQLYTPLLSCGLLPGTLREQLLEEKKVLEGIFYLQDLLNADAVYIGNSVRDLVKAEVVVEKTMV